MDGLSGRGGRLCMATESINGEVSVGGYIGPDCGQCCRTSRLTSRFEFLISLFCLKRVSGTWEFIDMRT